MMKKVFATAALLAALVPASSFAASITINSTAPTWSNVVGGADIALNQVNGAYLDVRWGTGIVVGQQSGLGFDPANPPATIVTDNTNFLLGTIRHYNFPIAGGTAATQVDLSLSTIVAGATPAAQDFAFRFFIDETPNGGTCVYPSVTPCADGITFANLDTSSSFTIAGQSYTLELIGFSFDSGASFTNQFISEEGGTNSAGLYARFTAPRSVPEPMSLALLGLGLAGLGVTVRKRK